MRVAVIFYHKNILNIYDRKWIEQCVDSIKAQTFQKFDVFELDYGGNKHMFAQGIKRRYLHFNMVLENHIEAMNWLYDYLFTECGYDVVFNTNMDDHYDPMRFDRQLKAIAMGYQLVSSNFNYIDDTGEIIKKMDMFKCGDIGRNLAKNHNVIAHPVVALDKSFWSDGLRYENKLGYEDLLLWQKAHLRKKKMIILPHYLLHYRIHPNQITKHHKGL